MRGVDQVTRSATGYTVEGRRAVVVGAARSGVAAAELLRSRGADVVLTDLRPAVDGSERLRGLGIVLELGGHRAATFEHAELVVVSPGVPAGQPDVAAARRAGAEVIGEIELASRFIRGPIVAITGTKGKSTTTTLVGRMLERAGRPALVGGNIGVPLSAQVDGPAADLLHVVETSSFQLESIVAFHPDVAVLLNVTADHLDRHPSFDDYVRAKANIFRNQVETDWAVANADDPVVGELVRARRARRAWFGLDAAVDEGATVDSEAIVVRSAGRQRTIMPVADVRLIGRHLLYDVLAAVAVGAILDLPDEAMAAAVAAFDGLEHALEPVATIRGVRFVNDSKATNIAAARQAVESFGAGLVVILGGRFKGGDFDDLRAALVARRATVVAIGEARPLIAEALGGALPVHEARGLDHAVPMAFSLAEPGATVLLAPGCASFDMFVDYAERGRRFKEEVQRLAGDMARQGEQ
jgi:UDP-N-acetylmuramoylalanine--D-glutamate ligase